jgi:hypothetical protein
MMVDLSPADVTPDRAAVLGQLGIPEGTEVAPRIASLCTAAATLFLEHAAPAGVCADVTADEFAAIYRGDGKNAPSGPVSDIFPRAEHLAVFAVTLGEGITSALHACFDAGDFALAYTLDAMASVAADGAAEVMERRYESTLRERGWTTGDGAALRYSPGYCGWDVTGQRRLFAHLRPERIGLTLTDSCLMQPLKSVSGVLIAGPKAIHRFRPDYDFCDNCADRTCRRRLRELHARTAVRRET